MWWIQNSKYFGFWLSGSFSQLTPTVFFILNNNFSFLRKFLENQLSCQCHFLFYWKRVVSHSFILLNPIFKAFWLLAEWRFFKMGSKCIIHSGSIVILFLDSYLETISHICWWIWMAEIIVSHSLNTFICWWIFLSFKTSCFHTVVIWWIQLLKHSCESRSLPEWRCTIVLLVLYLFVS